MTRRTARLPWSTRTCCLAAAMLLAACSAGDKPSKIAPTAEGIEEFVRTHGPSGFVLELSGEPRILAVVDEAGRMYWCPRNGGEELSSREQCMAAGNTVGYAQLHSTRHRPGIETHCMQAIQQVATNYGLVYSICVNSIDLDTTVDNPLAGKPYRFAAEAGEPMGLLADSSRRSTMFHVRLLPPGDAEEGPRAAWQREEQAVTDEASPGRPECSRLSTSLEQAKAEARRAPSAYTLQNQAMIEVEIVAMGCLDSEAQGNGAIANPAPSATPARAPQAVASPVIQGEPSAPAAQAAPSSSGAGADKTWTITGRAQRRTDLEYVEMMGDQVCFWPDPASVAMLPPRAPDDQRSVWFCFDNSRTAARTLGFAGDREALGCGLRAHATLVVSDYHVLEEDIGGSDMATLVEVREVSPPEAIECNE